MDMPEAAVVVAAVGATVSAVNAAPAPASAPDAPAVAEGLPQELCLTQPQLNAQS